MTEAQVFKILFALSSINAIVAVRVARAFQKQLKYERLQHDQALEYFIEILNKNNIAIDEFDIIVFRQFGIIVNCEE